MPAARLAEESCSKAAAGTGPEPGGGGPGRPPVVRAAAPKVSPPARAATKPIASPGAFVVDALSAAIAPPFNGVTRGLPAALAVAGLAPGPEPLTTEPDQGRATYGNVPPNALSLALTASPRLPTFAPSSLPST